MELRHLRYFVAVAEELHFRRAAERLYVAQPAVSEQIRKLEAELGVRLFDRTHRSVSLTDPGNALLVEARRVLHQAEVAQHAARNARDSATTRLRIGYVADALPGSVPRALQELASAAPRVEVSLETGATLSLIQSVHDQRLDAAIVALPAPTRGLRATSLGEQPMIVALPAGDPRAGADVITLRDLQPEHLVMMPRDANPALHDAVVSLCHQSELSPSFVEVADPRVEAVLLAVAAGGGAALLPASVTERYTAPGVRLIELADADPAFEVAVLSHPERETLAIEGFLRAVGRAIRPRPAAPPRLQVAA